MTTFRHLALSALAAATLTAAAQSNQAQIKKLVNAEFAISQFYVDSVDQTKLVEDAIRGMLDELDPHSSYTTPEETKELEEPLQGNFSGVGIQFNMKDDTLYVIQTVAGGPSERLGILAGDRIIEVNDTVIAGVGMKNTDIMKRLRGPKGTKVDVLVTRRGVPEPIHFRITRDDIPLYSVDAAYMADATTGYVRVSRFAEKTFEEFSDAVKKLKKKGMRQIIIDLTDNGGGYLQTAIEMANEFLDQGQSIVYTQGYNQPRYDAQALGRGSMKDMKVVVMVNQYSASASEILSGALQDWDRGVIVGRRTFGKGLVQRPIRFEDGSMMRLTVARYYTPAGRCIQKPYEPGDKEAYAKDIYNRYLDGELANADSIHFADSLKYTTLTRHRVIYGGGGIMPDDFVPLDTTEYSNYYRDLLAKGSVNRYVVNYVDANRQRLLDSYKSVEDFVDGFEVDDEMMLGLVECGRADSVPLDSAQWERSREMARTVVKALIARDIYTDPEAYYLVANRRNAIFTRALAIISDDELYNSLLSTSKYE